MNTLLSLFFSCNCCWRIWCWILIRTHRKKNCWLGVGSLSEGEWSFHYNFNSQRYMLNIHCCRKCSSQVLFRARKKHLNSSLPFGQAALKYFLPCRESLCLLFFYFAGVWRVWALGRWASKNENVFARLENLLVLGDRTALFRAFSLKDINQRIMTTISQVENSIWENFLK